MSAPRPWVKRIYSNIEELKQIPLFGNAPLFDFEEFASTLKKEWELDSLSISPLKVKVQEPVFEGMKTFSILIDPIGTIQVSLSSATITKLFSTTISNSLKTLKETSSLMQEGFAKFFLLKTLANLQKYPPFEDLSLELTEEKGGEEESFVIPIEIKINEETCFIELIISKEFRSEWIHHFSSTPTEYKKTALSEQLSLSLGIKTGSIILSQKELSSLKKGDFVLLDKTSYNPKKREGTSLLMLDNTPLFSLKIKSHQIELIDYAMYYEDHMEDNENTPSDTTPRHIEKLSSEEKESKGIKELPIQISVEVARLKMTLDQLMQLNPGNLLELPVQADEGVSLTVNGEKFAKGELVYLGESLGLRITEI